MSRFFQALKQPSHSDIPVWFMRQAGRYLPEYQALRKGSTFVEFCLNAERCVEATLLPLRRFDLDAAIVFSDILIPLKPMGLQLEFSEEGPAIKNPVRLRSDLSELGTLRPHEDTPVILETLSRLRSELPSGFPLLGFAGAPFTLACYAVEGSLSKSFGTIKRMIYEDEATIRKLIQKLTVMTISYLKAQVHAGANAVQLFDTWAGVLSPANFESLLLGPLTQIARALKETKVPFILYINGSSHLLPLLARAGIDVMSVDWRVPLPTAAKWMGPKVALQGNLDPEALFMKPPALKREVHALLASVPKRTRYIFNLGHGIVPHTPVDHVQKVIQWIRAYPA